MSNFLISRINREKYFAWMISLFILTSSVSSIIILFVSTLFPRLYNSHHYLVESYSFLFVPIIFSFITFKRCRDLGLNNIISFIGILIALFINWEVINTTLGFGGAISIPVTILLFGSIKGTSGPNQYGPDPLDTSNQTGNVPPVASTPAVTEVTNQPVSQEGNTQAVEVVIPTQV